MYHTVIVGGGLAGLQVAEVLATKGVRVLLLEKYPSFGGRVVTYRKDGLQYEIGAGRIFHAHKRIAALIKRFGLHTFPMSHESNFDDKPNTFNELFEPIRVVLNTVDPKMLATHTIKELVPSTLHPLLSMYPYTSEMDLMRADVALPLFMKGETMGSSNSKTAPFYGIVEGLDSLATGLHNAASDAGAECRTRHAVEDIKRLKDGLFEIQGISGKKADPKPFLFTAERVIIATCRCSLSGFSPLKDKPLLKQLGTAALLRIYAVFPHDPRTGKVWFEDLPKTVTAGPLRYVIPIDAKKGLIMISYTDGDDTKFWRPLEEKALETAILKETRDLFPDQTIPSPTFLKKHDWPSGCTYWLPGDYDVDAASLAAHNPAPGVYVVGESVSTEQAWMEGALQSAETLLRLLKN